MKVAIVLDPINQLQYYKDTSMAMCRVMAERGWSIDYIEHSSLAIEAGKPKALAQAMTMHSQASQAPSLATVRPVKLTDYQLILMRKDPPCDKNFIFNTMVLRLAEDAGVVVANKCDRLLTLNEKIFATESPDLCPPTLVSRDIEELTQWHQQHKDVVIKPLDGMGGKGIFHIKPKDDNASSIFETVTKDGSELAMLQLYIPEIAEGDKRILLIDGEPFDYALARIPKENEARANLATGGVGKSKPLTERDRYIANEVGKKIKGLGLYLVGIDIIGDYLTEINVTSPTGAQELLKDTGINPLEKLFDCLQKQVKGIH